MDSLRRHFAQLRLHISAGAGAPADAMSYQALIVAAVLLTLNAYSADLHPGRLAAELGLASRYMDLVPFWYRAAASALFRIVVPLAWIVFVFRVAPRDFGFRLPERGHSLPYLWLFLAVLPLVAAASFLPSFQATYPVYSGAGHSVGRFVLYQIPYGVRFVAVEAFFRGFLLFALARRLGHHAVPAAMVPYCMIHFEKPLGEALGSIVAGLVLGHLALRSRSWVPGAALHWAVALSMDCLALWQRRY